jgi:hypothetical protein
LDAPRIWTPLRIRRAIVALEWSTNKGSTLASLQRSFSNKNRFNVDEQDSIWSPPYMIAPPIRFCHGFQRRYSRLIVGGRIYNVHIPHKSCLRQAQHVQSTFRPKQNKSAFKLFTLTPVSCSLPTSPSMSRCFGPSQAPRELIIRSQVEVP